MDIIAQSIPEVKLIKPKVFGDERGYFYETHREDKLSEACGYEVRFVQGNQSRSGHGILRGLHFQSQPHPQAKLVRALMGAIIDVAVDIRRGSPTFGQHVSARLDADNKEQLFVPRGFAHGFCVLSDEAIVSYLVDGYYSAGHNQGIHYKDADLGIDWGLDPDRISVNERDGGWPPLAEQPEWFRYQADE